MLLTIRKVMSGWVSISWLSPPSEAETVHCED